MVTLGTYKFKVQQLPPPELYVGNSPMGGKLPRGTAQLNAKYGPNFPIGLDFKVLSWNVDFAGNPGPPKSGNGDKISADALRLLAQLPRDTQVTIEVRYQDPGGMVARRIGVFKR